MKTLNPRVRILFPLTALAALLMLLAACTPDPVYPATPTKTAVPGVAQVTSATAIPTATPPPAASPTVTEAPVETPTPTSEPGAEPTSPGPATETLPPPTLEDGLPAEHYILRRALTDDYINYGDRTYPYGGTAGGRLRAHTGLDMANPEGTPVVAAASGVVQYAGADTAVLYGPQPDFYGLLIVIQLDATFEGRPVFILYGHLSKILVETGAPVAAGDPIGEVGGTGVAAGGTHLHFEVRLDDPFDYYATRNPDLWISPYYGYGTLAGRVVDASGNYLPEVSITIRSEDNVRYTGTYAGEENNPSERWEENFTYGDLPEGWYSLTFTANGKTYREQFYIMSGRTTFLEFIVG